MIAVKGCSLAAALGALSVIVGPVPAAAQPAASTVATIEAVQGTVVRWSVPGTKRCAMGGRSWAALQETCYYPIDMLHAPGRIRVSRQGVGPASFARITVVASSYGTQDIQLGDIPQAGSADRTSTWGSDGTTPGSTHRPCWTTRPRSPPSANDPRGESATWCPAPHSCRFAGASDLASARRQ